MDDHTPPLPPPPPGADDDPPFGLPVLAEVPELAALLGDLVEVDRLLARTVETLTLLADSGRVEAATGVSVETWLAIVARRTGADVRMLGCAVRACRRLPSLLRAFSAAEVSWAQCRAIALKVDRAHVDDLALDAAVADAIATCQGSDPDALARMVGWAIERLRPVEATDQAAMGDEDGFLHLQPRLDGTGGQVYGDLGARPFAILDATTAPSAPPVGPTREGFTGTTDPDRAREATRSLGRQRATNLIDRLITTMHDDVPASPEVGSAAQGPRPPIPTKLLLRAELDTLLGRSAVPGRLLTSLAGGALRCAPDTARRLVDGGVELRLIVTEGGTPIGVGRATREPPGWLTDTLLAVHDTCTAPGCDRPALPAQTDHAIPWTDGGTTDLTNCGPLCRHHNHRKERDGWRARGHPDGSRRWHHPRTGLKVTTHPSTARPRDSDRAPP